MDAEGTSWRRKRVEQKERQAEIEGGRYNLKEVEERIKM